MRRRSAALSPWAGWRPGTALLAVARWVRALEPREKRPERSGPISCRRDRGGKYRRFSEGPDTFGACRCRVVRGPVRRRDPLPPAPGRHSGSPKAAAWSVRRCFLLPRPVGDVLRWAWLRWKSIAGGPANWRAAAIGNQALERRLLVLPRHLSA